MKVVCGPKVLVDSKIVSCSVEESFGQLLLRVEGGRFAEMEVHKVNIEDRRKGHHVVKLPAPLKLWTQFNCNAVVFNLVGQERPERSGRPNAVEILMNSSRRILLNSDEFIQGIRTEYAIVRPICFLGRSDGKRPATWGAPNVAKRARKH